MVIHKDFCVLKEEIPGRTLESSWPSGGITQHLNDLLLVTCKIVASLNTPSSCTPWLLSRLLVHWGIFQEVMTQIIFISTSHCLTPTSSILFSQPPTPTDTQCSFTFRQFPFLLRSQWLAKVDGVMWRECWEEQLEGVSQAWGSSGWFGRRTYLIRLSLRAFIQPRESPLRVLPPWGSSTSKLGRHVLPSCSTFPKAASDIALTSC